MTVTNVWGNQALDWLIRGRSVWVSLHSSNPGVTGDISTEISGGPDDGYERQPGTFSAAASRQVANSNVLVFTNLPASLVTYAGVWDASAFGNCIANGAFSATQNVGNGDMLVIQVPQLVISL